jgi:energy-coupling factor transporter ATP-binding protein EcfA2
MATTAITVTRKAGELLIETPFNKAYLEAIRNKTDAKWDKLNTIWRMPDTPDNQEWIKNAMRSYYSTEIEIMSATTKGMCKVEGCYKDVSRKELCQMHYQREYRAKKEAEEAAKEAYEEAEITEEVYTPEITEEAPEAVTEAPATTSTESPNLGALGDMINVLIDQRIGDKGPSGGSDIPDEWKERIERIEKQKARKIKIEIAGEVKIPDGIQHKIFPDILSWVANGQAVMLVGPSGSGKTWMCEQIAMVLGLQFYYTGAILLKYELLGYQDANGNYIRSPLRDAFEYGGVFLWDEIDASSPDCLVAFNALIESQLAAFPDGMVKRHPDFKPMGSGNTFGLGADRVYCGRNRLDGSSIQRFAVEEMNYDHDMELAICQPQTTQETEWIENVWRYRAAADKLHIEVIISPRQNLQGLLGIRIGKKVRDLEKSCIWKGLAQDQVTKIKNEAENIKIKAAEKAEAKEAF